MTREWGALIGLGWLAACGHRIHQVLEDCPSGACAPWRGDGGVTVRRDGEERLPRAGLRLKPGDEIEVGAGHVVVLDLGGENEAVLMPETLLRFGAPAVQHVRGEAWMALGESGGRWKVTDDVYTTDSGGAQYVTRAGNGRFEVVVLSGDVEVESVEGGRQQVRAGQRVVLSGPDVDPAASKIVDVRRTELHGATERLNRVARAAHPEGPQVLVPHLLGMWAEPAREYVEAEGDFTVRVDRVLSDEGKIGQVIGQSPGGGERAGRGRRLTLTVRSKELALPDVRGTKPGEAERTLRAGELSPSVQDERVFTCKHPLGTVARQSPAAEGQVVKEGQRVKLFVEGDSTVLADLRGLTPREAEQRAREGGLVVEFRYHPFPDVEVERVAQQSAAPGRCVDRQRPVVLDVEVPGVYMPDVVMAEAEDARADLLRVGLRPQLGPARCPPHRGPRGRVAVTDPAAGVVVGRGEEVYVDVFEGHVRVPDVVGMTLDRASDLLPAYDLDYREVYGFDVARVLSVSPSVGTFLCPGERALVTVSKPPG